MAPGIPFARPITSTVLRLDSPIRIPCTLRSMTNRSLSTRARAVIEIILAVPPAVVGAVVGYSVGKSFAPADERWLQIADSVGLGFGTVLACILLVWLGNRTISSIGLTTRQWHLDLGIGFASLLATWVVLMAIGGAIVVLFPSVLQEQSAAQKAIEASFPRLSWQQKLVLCLCIAIYEEIVFRGFLLTRLHVLVRRWWLAVVIGAVLFGLLHHYQGWLAVGGVTLLGLIMGALFAWRKSLVAPVTMHLFHNFAVFTVLDFVSGMRN
ncbi:MAG: lysostaphin resistance A-like protein [Phycisphaerae bacterium]